MKCIRRIMIKRSFWSFKKPTTFTFYPDGVDSKNEVVENMIEIKSETVQQMTDKLPETSGINVELIDHDIVEKVTETLTTISQVGDLKELGLASSFTPVGWIQSLLEINHVMLGLPWWGTIAATTIFVRFLVLPLTIKSQRAMGKMAVLRPQIEPIQEQMQHFKKLGDSQGVAQQAQKLQILFKNAGINPLSAAAYGFAQAPIFISFFLAVRKMGDLPVPGFESGGMYWFHDLSLADPYYILPIVSSMGMIAGFELNSDVTKNQSPFIKNVIRGISLAAIPLIGGLPAAVFVYMTTSSMATLFQIIVLKRKTVRKLLDLPDLNLLVSKKDSGMLAVRPLSLTEAITKMKKERLK